MHTIANLDFRQSTAKPAAPAALESTSGRVFRLIALGDGDAVRICDHEFTFRIEQCST